MEEKKTPALFYLRLKDLCFQRGESLRSMCEQCVIATASPTKWKNGAMPDVATLKKLADHFDTSIDDLVGYRPAVTTILNAREHELVRAYNVMSEEDRQTIDDIVWKYRRQTFKVNKPNEN